MAKGTILALAILMLTGLVLPGACGSECGVGCSSGACQAACASCPCCQAQAAVPLLATLEPNPDSTPVPPALEEAPRPSAPRGLLHVPRPA